MFAKMISIILVVAFVHSSIAAQDQGQSPPQTVSKMQQVLHKAKEKDKAVRVTLNKKIEGRRKLSGKVSEVSDTGFVVIDQKTGATTKLAYADVQEIHQKGWSKAAKIAVVVLAGVVIAAVVIGYTITGGD